MIVRIVALALSVALATGCRRDEPRVAVGGTVRAGAEKLSGVEVQFVADNGEFFKAATNADGQFHVAALPAGRYVVLLREPFALEKLAGKGEPGLPGNPARHAQKLQTLLAGRIPARYGDLAATPLRNIVVADGLERLDFAVVE